jgi:regulator of sigma E protease
MLLFGLVLDLSIAIAVAVLFELAAKQRPWVPIAGRLSGLLLGYLVLVALLLPLNRSQPLAVVEPMEGMQAAAAGIERGDRVRAVNGVPVETFFELGEQVSLSGSELTLSIERAGTKRDVVVHREIGGPIGLKPTGEARVRPMGQRMFAPVEALFASLRSSREILFPSRFVSAGGPIVVQSVENDVSPLAMIAVTLGISASTAFPLVAATMLASLLFRSRLLKR